MSGIETSRTVRQHPGVSMQNGTWGKSMESRHLAIFDAIFRYFGSNIVNFTISTAIYTSYAHTWIKMATVITIFYSRIIQNYDIMMAHSESPNEALLDHVTGLLDRITILLFNHRSYKLKYVQAVFGRKMLKEQTSSSGIN